MQKRKLKLNVLDISIFIVIICSIAVLAFRDNINEIFGKPETITLEVTVVTDTVNEPARAWFTTGTAVELIPAGSSEKIRAVIVSSSFAADGTATVTVYCNGYKRLGRYYSEIGSKLNENSEYVIAINDLQPSCRVQTVEIAN